jgi:lipid-A-disaccharide synthase
MYDALQAMDAAIVASGTATLEAALCGVPMSVVYRTSWPTYYAARLVLRVPDIALVNVVAGRRMVPEFVQHRAHPYLIGAEAIELLRKGSRREKMKADLKEVAAALGPPGATARAAEAVLQLLPN